MRGFFFVDSDAVLEALLEICRNFLASDAWRRQLAALLLLAALLEEEHSSQGVMRHADTVRSPDTCSYTNTTAPDRRTTAGPSLVLGTFLQGKRKVLLASAGRRSSFKTFL